MKRILLSTLAGLTMLAGTSVALAQNTVKVAMCVDISKSYTFITPQIVSAARDLATLINSKGGFDGTMLEVVVQDTGNEPQRGIECYEKVKREGVLFFDFLSTPVSRAVLPRAMADGNVMGQSFVGRGDAIDGSVFKWIFPIGPTYWGQMANNLHYIKTQHKGSLKDVKIAFIYPDYAFGQEPIGVLKAIADKEGANVGLFPNPMPGRDQAAVWTQIRRFNPDWVITWNLAAMHVVGAREMKRNGIAMDKLITVNWLNEVDIANIGPAEAKGLKRGTNVVGGQDHPLIQEIYRELYDKGKGAGDRKLTEDVYYNTGLAVYSAVYEGIRLAIKNEGLPLTPAKLKAGLESLKDFDANGLIAPVTVTAEDHGGGGKTRIDMWDGEKWVAQSDWIAAYQDEVMEIVKKESAEFAKQAK